MVQTKRNALIFIKCNSEKQETKVIKSNEISNVMSFFKEHYNLELHYKNIESNKYKNELEEHLNNFLEQKMLKNTDFVCVFPLHKKLVKIFESYKKSKNLTTKDGFITLRIFD